MKIRLLNRMLLPLLVLLAYQFYSHAQLSHELLHILPDSVKPVPNNKPNLAVEEKGRILSFALSNAHQYFYKELDSIAKSLSKDIERKKIDDTVFNNLLIIGDYYFGTKNYDSALQYFNRIIFVIQHKMKYDAERYICYKKVASIYNKLNRQEEGVRYLNGIMEDAIIKKDSFAIAQLFRSLSDCYTSLRLYHYALSVLDSSLVYINGIEQDVKVSILNQEIYACKCLLYFDLREETGQSDYIRRIDQVLLEAKRKNIHHPLFNDFPVAIAYYDVNYSYAIRISDSILADLDRRKPDGRLYLAKYIKKYKALSLFKMGKGEEAVKMIKELLADFQHADYKGRNPDQSEIHLFSGILYKYYEENKQWKEAFYHLSMFSSSGEELNILDNRGKVFEIQQQHNLAKKELEINGLKGNNIISKNERNIAIYSTIVSVLLLFIVGLVLYNRNRRLKIKQLLTKQQTLLKVEKMQIASQLQISEIKEENKIAVQKEQKKLGRELHDNLAGNLAFIKIKLETEALHSSGDAELQERLDKIAKLVDQTYETVIERSQQLYNIYDNSTSSLEDMINLMMLNGMEISVFEKEIILDNDALKSCSFDTKIDFLYIIKESVTNIVKTARPKRISILIYEDNPGVIIKINYDGPGIQMKDIEKRIESIEAKMKTDSVVADTEITIIIPLVKKPGDTKL